MDRPRLIADIKSAESCRLAAYRDSLGIWTIGWGHELVPQDLKPGQTYNMLVWTQDEAEAQLDRDIEAAVAKAMLLPEWKFLDKDARQNAVCELVFNMGIGRWRPFAHTRNALCHCQWQAAHDGLLDSLWAEQVHKTRADRLANYLLTGEFGRGT